MRNITKTQWDKYLGTLEGALQDHIVQIAQALVDGDRLGYETERSVRLKQHPVFRSYRAIADGSVLPEIVWGFAHTPLIYDRVRMMPVEAQRMLLKNRALPTVEMRDGKVTAVDKPLHVASSADYLRACNKGGVRSFEEQKKTLLAAMPKPRAEKRRESRSAAIKADKATGEIVWNDLRAKPQDFVLVMKQLGWTLSK